VPQTNVMIKKSLRSDNHQLHSESEANTQYTNLQKMNSNDIDFNTSMSGKNANSSFFTSKERLKNPLSSLPIVSLNIFALFE